MKLKYVILRDRSNSDVVFVIDSAMNHSDLPRYFEGWKVISAGFCSIADSDEYNRPAVQVWGESVSLNIKSREEDAGILSIHFSS